MRTLVKMSGWSRTTAGGKSRGGAARERLEVEQPGSEVWLRWRWWRVKAVTTLLSIWLTSPRQTCPATQLLSRLIRGVLPCCRLIKNLAVFRLSRPAVVGRLLVLSFMLTLSILPVLASTRTLGRKMTQLGE